MISIARLAGAFGVHGEVRLVSLTSNPDDVFDYPQLYLPNNTVLHVKSHRLLKDNEYAVRITGITNRTQAEALPKVLLSVPRDQMPELAEDDDFYYHDLIGLQVHTTTGTVVGSIKAVCNYGGGDLLVINTDNTEILFPFTKADVPSVLLSAKQVIINADTWLELQNPTKNDTAPTPSS